MTRNRLTWLRVAALASLVVALSSCGGGGGEEREISVSINDPTESSTYTTNSEALTLGGTASIETVSVSWSNAADGGGAASVTAGRSWDCVFPLLPFVPAKCSTPATWIASIPLVVGTNDITVVASDGDGNSGRATITITRLPPKGAPDTTPPTVSSTIPANGATNVAVNYPISVVFGEQMSSTSINGTTFRLVDGSGNPVAGTVTYTDKIAKFTPANSLAYLAPYTASIVNGVKDLAGNSMAANYVWSFTTTGVPDTTPPTVTSTSPANGADHVDPENIGVLVTFSEQVDSRSVSPSTFALKDGSGNLVSGVIRVTNGGKSAEFRPSIALENSMPYAAIVTTGIKDLAGNTLAEDYSWTFVTEAQRVGTWQATSTTGAPSGRWGNTAAWTGREMIVWGGSYGYLLNFDTGARYDPATNTWQLMAISGAPYARAYHTAVWTGSEVIIWGGYDGSSTLRSGARYNPATDTWQPMTTSGAPSARFRHTAVWTGSEMIVWGGGLTDTTFFDSGARYDPANDTWQPITTSGAPSARDGHTAVWTGSEMLVWAGSKGKELDDLNNLGARYDATTDTWQAMTTVGAPSARRDHTAIWTGSKMIVWGGQDRNRSLDTGGRFRP